MITESDLKIISHLRKNARKKVTHISKELNIPVTTIYDKIRSHEKKGIVKKHVTLLDFMKMGYNANVLIAFKVSRDQRNSFQSYLEDHPGMNSLYRVDYGHDFMADMVFRDISRMHEFIEDLQEKFSIEEPKIFNIIQELKKEEFLSS